MANSRAPRARPFHDLPMVIGTAAEEANLFEVPRTVPALLRLSTRRQRAQWHLHAAQFSSSFSSSHSRGFNQPHTCRAS